MATTYGGGFIELRTLNLTSSFGEEFSSADYKCGIYRLQMSVVVGGGKGRRRIQIRDMESAQIFYMEEMNRGEGVYQLQDDSIPDLYSAVSAYQSQIIRRVEDSIELKKQAAEEKKKIEASEGDSLVIVDEAESG